MYTVVILQNHSKYSIYNIMLQAREYGLLDLQSAYTGTVSKPFFLFLVAST